jgi:hypothetical protein
MPILDGPRVECQVVEMSVVVGMVQRKRITHGGPPAILDRESSAFDRIGYIQ